jgi:hypothetical protein
MEFMGQYNPRVNTYRRPPNHLKGVIRASEARVGGTRRRQASLVEILLAAKNPVFTPGQSGRLREHMDERRVPGIRVFAHSGQENTRRGLAFMDKCEFCYSQ